MLLLQLALCSTCVIMILIFQFGFVTLLSVLIPFFVTGIIVGVDVLVIVLH